MDYLEKNIKKLVFLALLLVAGLSSFVSSCTSIDTGTVGVVKHFGAVEPYVLPEGLAFVRPFSTDIVVVPTSMQSTEAEAIAASKDLQGVHTKVTVQWSVDPNVAPRFVRAFGYGDGAWTNGIVSPAIQEVVKAISARYTAEELITKRHEVKVGIELGLADFIKKTLAEKHTPGAVHVINVAITNFEFSKEFDQSIEAKVKAEQDSLRAENEKKTRITQAEAKAREVTLAAEAAAKQTTLTADANAYSIDAESKAKAAAIERESKALSDNPKLVELRRIEQAPDVHGRWRNSDAAGETVSTESLAEALPHEMARVRDTVMPAYQEIGLSGVPALALMRLSLDAAAKALAEGDVVAMLAAHQDLKGYTL